MTRRLVVATGNPGKLAEYRRLLAGLDAELVTWSEEVEESGDTFAANAVLKAEAASAATGLPAVGDDGGLEIEALGGAPGLHSRRIAATQEERNRILVERLAGRPRPWTARFTCAVAVSAPGLPARVAEASVPGEFLPEPRGADGFGYDPVFLVAARGLTYAELGDHDKDALSHRALALRRLAAEGALDAALQVAPH